MTRSFQKQQGASLVSLMVGMTVSLITILAMTATHKLVTYTALETTKELSRDSQVISSIKNASMEILQAGYGVLPTESGQNIWVSTDGKRMAWRYRQHIGDVQFVCGGLEISNSDGRQGLFLVNKPACGSASDAAIWDVPERQQLGSQAAFYDKEGEVLGLTLARAVFVKETASACAPFGYRPHWETDEEDDAIVSMISVDTPHPSVSLMIDGQRVFQSCLMNVE